MTVRAAAGSLVRTVVGAGGSLWRSLTAHGALVIDGVFDAVERFAATVRRSRPGRHLAQPRESWRHDSRRDVMLMLVLLYAGMSVRVLCTVLLPATLVASGALAPVGAVLLILGVTAGAMAAGFPAVALPRRPIPRSREVVERALDVAMMGVAVAAGVVLARPLEVHGIVSAAGAVLLPMLAALAVLGVGFNSSRLAISAWRHPQGTGEPSAKRASND